MIQLPHGETNITYACQNKCVACNHFAPARQPWHAQPADIERDLAMAAPVVHFKQYAILGGEPTLHPQLLEILRIVRRSGIADRIELATNGQNAERWSDEVYLSIDDLQLTPYKLPATEQAAIVAKCHLFHVNIEWQPTDYFHYAVYRRRHSDEYAQQLYQTCWYAQWRQVIDAGYFYRCCVGRHIPEMLWHQPAGTGGLALATLTEESLRDYLAPATVPAECYMCGACNQAPALPWHEQPDRDQWWQESLAGSEVLA